MNNIPNFSDQSAKLNRLWAAAAPQIVFPLSDVNITIVLKMARTNAIIICVISETINSVMFIVKITNVVSQSSSSSSLLLFGLF